MIARRDVIGGSVVASLFTGESGGQQIPERVVEEMTSALKDIRRSLDAQRDFHEIEPVRLRIVEFLRAHMKFPDYLEVGTDAWLAISDWHVRNVLPLTVAQDGAGHYTMLFMQTTLVLRPDMVPNFIGAPCDSR